MPAGGMRRVLFRRLAFRHRIVAQLGRVAIEQYAKGHAVGVVQHLGQAALKILVQIGPVAPQRDRDRGHGQAALPQQIFEFLPYRVAFHRSSAHVCHVFVAYLLLKLIVNDKCSS